MAVCLIVSRSICASFVTASIAAPVRWQWNFFTLGARGSWLCLCIFVRSPCRYPGSVMKRIFASFHSSGAVVGDASWRSTRVLAMVLLAFPTPTVRVHWSLVTPFFLRALAFSAAMCPSIVSMVCSRTPCGNILLARLSRFRSFLSKCVLVRSSPPPLPMQRRRGSFSLLNA